MFPKVRCNECGQKYQEVQVDDRQTADDKSLALLSAAKGMYGENITFAAIILTDDALQFVCNVPGKDVLIELFRGALDTLETKVPLMEDYHELP